VDATLCPSCGARSVGMALAPPDVTLPRLGPAFVALAIPLLVAFARLYRGMHHITDIAAGLLNGVICALLAVGWYKHRARTAASPPKGVEPPGASTGQPD